MTKSDKIIIFLTDKLEACRLQREAAEKALKDKETDVRELVEEYTNQSLKSEGMSLDEAKDEVARKKGFADWKSLYAESRIKWNLCPTDTLAEAALLHTQSHVASLIKKVEDLQKELDACRNRAVSKYMRDEF